MKKLVQKIFDIDPSIMSDDRRLQEYMNKKSEDNWEYCGQIGLFHLFKRWEEVPNVISGGGSQQPSFQYNPPQYNPPSYQYPYNNYNNYSYGGYRGSYNNNGYQYRPDQFGTRVDNEKDDDNPFD